NRGDAPRADTAAARGERALAARADSLTRGIAQAAQDLARAANVANAATDAQPLASSQDAARRAQRAMGQAAGAAVAGDPRAAGAAGTEAETALAGEAVDALNATALALARSRGQVAGARSGTGFAEAVEQLARLAESQRGLNGQAQGLLPLMGMGGQAVLEQLRALATRQRALAEQLERLQAAGASPAAGPLAEEARELARQLEAGRLDRQTIERQSRLYRRLLHAGRPHL